MEDKTVTGKAGYPAPQLEVIELSFTSVLCNSIAQEGFTIDDPRDIEF